MECPRCRHDNTAGAASCSLCGGRLGLACPGCGRANPPGSRFCNRCGTALPTAATPRFATPDAYTPRHLAGRIATSRVALEGERKQVTVLFADIQGSLEMVAGRDPEEARELLDGVIERMMAAVHAYEGTVNQVMGDGIMALFGAPVAHEDHALRACYAALRMLDAMADHAAALRRAGRAEPRIRVGLNSGEVVVRSISSDLYMDYSAVGNSTHLAARMEQIARPGSAYLTANTWRLVEGRVEVRAVGEVAVKGLSDPVTVYELVRATGARSRLEVAARRGLTRFVGREAELAALTGALDRAASGAGQVVAVVGEAGVGKSRLVWELVHSGRLDGWRVLEAQAAPYGKGAPYAPIVDLLRAHFRLDTGDDPAAVRRRVAAMLGPDEAARFISPALALLGMPVDDDEWTRLDPGPKRRRTLETVRRILTRAARLEPVCVVVEDLHWADPETLAVLDSVVDSAAASRLLVVVTCRPEHQHGWGGKAHCTELALGTLPAGAVALVLDALLGGAPELSALRGMLAERTGGNPFFIEESVRNLVETGALAGAPGRRQLVRLPGVAQVPDTVHAVVAARIDRLVPADKRVLQTAAAIGRDVPRALLAAVAEIAPDDLADSLARLQAGEFLHEARLFPDVEYAFRHALIQEVAYGGMLRERRRALDARIVEALEAAAGDGETPHLDRLAHHALRGELWDRAVTYCRRSGRQALARFAHRGAAAYFEQALTALGRLPAGDETAEVAIDLRLELRNALVPLGEYRRVRELLTEAEGLARAAGDRRRLGRIACYLCNYFTLRFEFAEAVEHGSQALAIATAVDDAPLARATSALLALAHYGYGNYPDAIEAGARAAGDAPPPGAERFGLVLPPAVYGPTIASWALAEQGRFREAAVMAGRALATAEALNHPHSVIFACLGLGTVHLRRGAACEAIAVLERALATWETADLPAVLLELAGPLASAYAAAGRAGDAIALLERGIAHALALRHRLGNVLRSGGLAEAYLAANRPDEALPLAQLYVDLTRMVNGRGHLAWALRLLGDAAARVDPPDAERARAALGEADALARELGMRPLEARVALTRAGLLERLGDAAGARRLAEAAAEQFAVLDMPAWAAACHAGR
jgi:class 3 adenylate cyclase/tetratricopeptide (TPR) repeat protein